MKKKKKSKTGWSVPVKYRDFSKLVWKTKKELLGWMNICISKKPKDCIPKKVRITIEEL